MESISRKMDTDQAKLMREEFCIVVDENDVVIGERSKEECHLMTNINRGLLHRAFSVFLFDKDRKLLLQQRADEKITFPKCWTNTCCSHPLANIPGESDGVEGFFIVMMMAFHYRTFHVIPKTSKYLTIINTGVKKAAKRKLLQEMGISDSGISLDSLKCVTRIHYKAPADTIWGEHEIDYILLAMCAEPFDVIPNRNEVQAIRYVTVEETKALMNAASSGEILVTPWFRMIFERFLFQWWEQLLSEDIGKLKTDNQIHRLM